MQQCLASALFETQLRARRRHSGPLAGYKAEAFSSEGRIRTQNFDRGMQGLPQMLFT